MNQQKNKPVARTGLIREMLESGSTKMEVAAKLRELEPSLSPTWLRKCVEHTIQNAKRDGRPINWKRKP